MDKFLELFADDFEVQTVAGARTLEGPHVYLVVSPNLIKYAKGLSAVSYIGYTDVPRTRFANHLQVGSRDKLFVTPLQPILHEVKRYYTDWRSMSEREHRSIREHAERLFIYLFIRLLGDMPIKNTRKDMPAKEAILVAEFLLKWKHSQRAVANAAQAIQPLKRQLALLEDLLTSRSGAVDYDSLDTMAAPPMFARAERWAPKRAPAASRSTDNPPRERPESAFASGAAIVRALRSHLPRHLRRDEAANGAIVFVDSDGLQRLMIYEYNKHCQVRIRCARDWGQRGCGHRSGDRNAHGWLNAIRVERAGDLRDILDLYATEWGVDE